MHLKLEQFEGPLDLLLGLIEGEDLDITKISLSKITDEYLAYMTEIEEKRPDELADFLVIAAKLLFIKSKALMPYLIWEDEDDAEGLEKQLKLYKEFLEASKKIQEILDTNKMSYCREQPVATVDVSFNPPQKINKLKLSELYHDVLSKLTPIFKLPKRLIAKTISLKERIFQIKDLIANQQKISFNQIIETSSNRADVIVSFLALLEMVKQKEINLYQEVLFEEIIIESKI